MIGQLIAILFVLLLLVGTLFVVRRQGWAAVNFALDKRAGREKLMQVVERVPLTPQHSLHLVRLQDKMILIGVSPSGCNRIDSFPAAYAGQGSERAQ